MESSSPSLGDAYMVTGLARGLARSERVKSWIISIRYEFGLLRTSGIERLSARRARNWSCRRARPRRRSRAQQMQHDLDALREHIWHHPGATAMEIGGALGMASREITRPIKKLIAAGEVRETGVKSHTRASPPTRETSASRAATTRTIVVNELHAPRRSGAARAAAPPRPAAPRAPRRRAAARRAPRSRARRARRSAISSSDSGRTATLPSPRAASWIRLSAAVGPRERVAAMVTRLEIGALLAGGRRRTGPTSAVSRPVTSRNQATRFRYERCSTPVGRARAPGHPETGHEPTHARARTTPHRAALALARCRITTRPRRPAPPARRLGDGDPAILLRPSNQSPLPRPEPRRRLRRGRARPAPLLHRTRPQPRGGRARPAPHTSVGHAPSDATDTCVSRLPPPAPTSGFLLRHAPSLHASRRRTTTTRSRFHARSKVPPMRSRAARPGGRSYSSARLLASWALRLGSLGLADHIALRTAAIDDALRDACAARTAQVVILGAGLDARAWRLAALSDAVVFEVDHPATQRLKGSRVGALDHAREVPFVAADFKRESVADRLAKEGHDAARDTFWVWEGDVMYLPSAAVRASLDAVRARSAPGSRLAVTYGTREDTVWLDRFSRTVTLGFQILGEPLVGLHHPLGVPRSLGRRPLACARRHRPARLACQVRLRRDPHDRGAPRARGAALTARSRRSLVAVRPSSTTSTIRRSREGASVRTRSDLEERLLAELLVALRGSAEAVARDARGFVGR